MYNERRINYIIFLKLLFQMHAAESDLWKTSYIGGANFELYTETLSGSFKGMGFQQVSE